MIRRISIYLTLTVVCGIFSMPRAHASISLVNHTICDTVANSCLTCLMPGNSCTIDIPSTGAGHALVLYVSGTGTEQLASVTGGGTWTHCPHCAVTDGYSAMLDGAYVLNSTAGSTSITITLTDNEPYELAIEVIEYAKSIGGFALDVSGNRVNQYTCTSCPGVALLLSGTSDVIVQATTMPDGAVIGISGTYTFPFDVSSDGIAGFAGRMNTGSGVAPVWNQSPIFLGGPAGTIVSAMSLK